ncbi:hypothetical protein Daesc_005341 [Daldinia eschscholtzii]|uniref:Uncharacterized protein n=1 Tax=Daldinia eschscholtzii TaxID=292717 RepID=A0AAX6MKS0_9PEZI
MPRPKRTRVASTRTVAKATSPEHVVVSKQTVETSSDIYDVSDREKEKAKQRRESMRDADTTTRTRSTSSHQLKALEVARQRRDSAMERLENMTSTSTNQLDEPEEPEEPSVELGRKVAGTPQQRRMADMSGLDLDDSDFDDLNTTFDTAGPASAQRSAETSTLSASVFRRRPRAGSFLGGGDGYIRPSSRTGPTTPAFSSTFNIGMFKRRVREPSILGTAQKPRPQKSEPEPEPESDQDEDEDEEALDEDGFAPEAESTPLKPSKRCSGEVKAGPASPQDLPSSNSRKRKSTEGHERRAKSSPFEDDHPIEDSVPQQSDSELSSPPSTPPPRQPSSRPVTPIMDEELMAPPLSSGSSAGDSEVWPPLQSLARAHHRRPASVLRRTPVANDNVSDISSPPSLTYSPNYRKPSTPPRQAAKAKRKNASKSEPKVTTADLASMLPRRRRRNARADDEDSEAEVDISGLGDDDDELSYLDVRARRQPARPGSRAGHSKNQNAGRARPTSRGKAAKQQTNGANRRTTITYGRTSDKENQGESEVDEAEGGETDKEQRDGEESSQDMVSRVGEELKNAARKFQEVDKWQLDYEEMTQSSSPRDAR